MGKGVLIVFVLISLISAGAFAESLSNGAVSSSVESFVGEIAGKQGISSDQIKKVTQVDQNNLPDELQINEIDENKVGIYSVDYTEDSEDKNLYVITYSTNQLPSSTTSLRNVQTYSFGFVGIISENSYLATATGVATGDDKGYVMMRSGSITGISTNVELTGEGFIEIKILKNGIDTGFNNKISSEDSKKLDFDLQSENIVTYEAGDMISVYVKQSGEVNWGNVITLVETTNS
jgi:hypothetical protein